MSITPSAAAFRFRPPAASWRSTFSAGIGWSTALPSYALDPEQRPLALGVASGILAVSWLLPAILYVPLLSVSVPKGALLSLFQMLLRAFLYVLIIAIVRPMNFP